MCAASIENAGPCLIVYCLCEWIIKKNYPADFVSKLLSGEKQMKCQCYYNI